MNRKVLPMVLFVAACGGAAVTAGPSMNLPARIPGAVWPDEGPRTWTERSTVPEITANDLRTRLYQIADDSMRGRPIGSEGNYKATAYIAREFQRLGLKPAGDNGTYFQELDWGALSFDSSAVSLSLAGAPLARRTDFIPMTPSTLYGATRVANLSNTPTIFAGRWGDTTVAIDANALRGKVAVFIPALPTQGANGRAGPVPRDHRASRAGAAGVFITALDNAPPAQVNAAFGTRNGMMPTVEGNMAGAIISQAVAARMFGKPVADVAVGTVGQPVSASWSYNLRKPQWPARNVLAVLPGSDPARAGEYVLLGAHNDHVNPMPAQARGVDHDSLRAFNKVMRPQGANDPVRTPNAEQQRKIDSLIAYARSIRPPRRDSIMNGADDDGSGTVVLLEVAERFAGQKTGRSIIFNSHQGEEAGLLGSQWFVEHPTVPLKQIVAAFNMDMLGKGRVTDVQFGGPNSLQTLGSRRIAPQLGDIIDSVNAITSEPIAFDRSWDTPANKLNRFCRSDQVNYVNADIPTTYFSLGYAADYHQLTDEPAYIDYEHGRKIGKFVHEVMTAIADRKDRPLVVGQDPLYPSCR